MAKRQEAKPQASDGSPSPSIEPVKDAVEKDLPVVEAPKLDASEEGTPPSIEMVGEAASEPAAEPVGEPAALAAPARSSRFALLAASVALAAALGSIGGSLSAVGFAHLWPVAAPRSGTAEANALQAMKSELAELSALKANLDGAMRSANGQFAKIADRLDHVERAQIDPASKIAHIAEAIDRLERKSVTASAAPAAPAAPETTGSVASSPPATPTETKLPDRVLQNWIVQDVRGGHALVESRYGGVFDVTAGSVLPGLGRVETIKRQDGQWVVVTARGAITSGR